MLLDIERDILHAKVYDPRKAHEYYLRTRQLRGRRTGSQDASSSRNGAHRSGDSGSGGTSNADMRDSRREDLEAQREKLRDLVERLKEILRDKVDEAKKRSGVKEPEAEEKTSTKETKDTKDTKSKDTKDKPLTEKQKAEKRKASKEQYEKENRMSLHTEVEALQRTVKDLRAKIVKAGQEAREKQAHNQTA